MNKELIVQMPWQGIARSPHVGFGNIRNIDIYTTPGVAKLNNPLVNVGTPTDFVKWIVKNPASPANYYAIDNDGVVYNSSNSGATWASLSDRTGTGQGMIVWKDYLIVATDTGLDTYGPLSGTAGWTTGWQTIDTDGAWHPMIVSKNDGNVYGGAGRYVFSILEVSGQNFAPGTAATFTFTQQALDLPEDYKVKNLVELGNNLMIGTWQGTNIYDVKVADIFPWDRVSPTFGQPVQINENGVNAMINIGNQLYVMAGIEGNIYRCDGYNAVKIAEIPEYVADLSGGKYLEPYPGAIMSYKGRLFFGISGSGATGGCGVYSLMQTASGAVVIMENQISTESTGAANALKVTSLIGVSRDTYIASWQDNTSFGIDKINNGIFNYTTAYQGYFETPLYKVGTFLNKRKFDYIEFQLAKEFGANEGVKIEYRVNLTDSFTEIDTGSVSALGAITSHRVASSIPECEYLQLRISLVGTTTTPNLQSVTLF